MQQQQQPHLAQICSALIHHNTSLSGQPGLPESSPIALQPIRNDDIHPSDHKNHNRIDIIEALGCIRGILASGKYVEWEIMIGFHYNITTRLQI